MQTDETLVIKNRIKLIIGFVQSLESQKKQPNTIRKYHVSIKTLLFQMPKWDVSSFSKFIDAGTKNDSNESYLNIFIYTARLFNRYLLEIGYKVDNKLSNYPHFIKNRTIMTGSLSKAEIEAILNTTREGNEWEEEYDKWRIFFAVIAFTGMTPGEVALLTRSNIDIDKKIILSNNNKSLQNRIIPIPKRLIVDIRSRYIDTKSFLFSRKSNNDKPEISSNWFYQFRKRLNKIGISNQDAQIRHLTVMSLRKYYIEECLNNGIDVPIIERIAGHSDIRTTMNYGKNIDIQNHNLISKIDEIFDANKN